MQSLREAAEYVSDRLTATSGVKVKYVRGSLAFEVTAVVGETPPEARDYDGVLIQSFARDFTIRQRELAKYLGDEHQPRRNDQIHQRVDGVTHVFYVNAPSPTASHYIDSDGYGVGYRIHTIRDEVVQ